MNQQITADIFEQHRATIDNNFTKTNQAPAETDTKNIEVVTQHFIKVFNNDETKMQIENILQYLGNAKLALKNIVSHQHYPNLT